MLWLLYYHIYLSPYTLQADLIIYGQVISSGEMVFVRTYLFPININSHYYVLQIIIPINKNKCLRTIINGSINVICYYLKVFLPPCLRFISHNYYNTLSHLNIPMKEHDNIMYENNLSKCIKFDRSFSMSMKDTT